MSSKRCGSCPKTKQGVISRQASTGSNLCSQSARLSTLALVGCVLGIVEPQGSPTVTDWAVPPSQVPPQRTFQHPGSNRAGISFLLWSWAGKFYISNCLKHKRRYETFTLPRPGAVDAGAPHPPASQAALASLLDLCWATLG